MENNGLVQDRPTLHGVTTGDCRGGIASAKGGKLGQESSRHKEEQSKGRGQQARGAGGTLDIPACPSPCPLSCLSLSLSPNLIGHLVSIPFWFLIYLVLSLARLCPRSLLLLALSASRPRQLCATFPQPWPFSCLPPVSLEPWSLPLPLGLCLAVAPCSPLSAPLPLVSPVPAGKPV